MNWIDKQFDDLNRLADERFGPLSEAETKLLRAIIIGETAWCGPSQKNDDPHNIPSSEEDWLPERQIRAELLRWLCVDKTAEGHCDPRGIGVHGAKVSGRLNLSYAVVRFPFRLRNCRFTDDILILSTAFASLNFSGSYTKKITAEGLKVSGNVFLDGGFRAIGAVSLMGAQIEGTLACNDGIFTNPAQKDEKESGTALNAQNVRVNGDVFLRGGFQAQGEVSLMGAQIGGDLDCRGGIFRNPAQEGVPSSGTALQIEGATIKGNVLLRQGFVAEGQVSLMGTQITGDFDTSGGSFGYLNGQRMSIKQTLFWRQIKNIKDTALDLEDASAGSLVDEQASWPEPGKLVLDGFTYGRIAEGTKDSKGRLEWLGREESFSRQPYRQLAKVLREEGDDPGARHVIYEMEKRKLQDDGKHGWTTRFWNLVFRMTIGYGIYPRRALWWLLLLVVLGWGVYQHGYSAGIITPTSKDDYAKFHDNHQPPGYYPHFYAFVYSAENCFPLVKLGQAEFWAPDPNQRGLATILRCYRWFQVLLGWTLGTFFVAGVTGITRND